MTKKRHRPKEGTNVSEPKHNLVPKIKTNMSLIDRCRLRMSSSLLRLMDETIYDCDSTEVSLDKDKFKAYHEAYSKVCEKWPTKPIDYIVKFIKKRLLVKGRRLEKYRFADVGCGPEPLLKKGLPNKVKVSSFDLVSGHEDITEANMQKLPLDSDSVNGVVYSLSLMAKNLGTILLEAKRILKLNGSLLIVEVTSRFDSQEKKFISKLEKLGFKNRSSKQLPPNGYFTFFHFTKTDQKLDYSGARLNIELKPCVYKTR